MNYFRFIIPLNEDGSRVSYSPNYHGTMPKCPKNVTALLYNDRDGYGIAKTEDSFIPPEVITLTEKDALSIVSNVEVSEGVYIGDKVLVRDNWLSEDVEVFDGK